MIQQRITELAALLMVGDGIVGLMQPERHTRLWWSGPRRYREAMEPFVRSPALTRVAGAAEAAVGLWLASRQKPEGAEHG